MVRMVVLSEIISNIKKVKIYDHLKTKIMKKIFTLILSSIALTGLAQPTITSSMAPQPGQSETTYDVDETTVMPGPSGANQTWNFSTALPLGTSNTTNYINPNSTPYAALFPGTNLAIDQSSGTDTIYGYLQNTTSLTQILGVYANAQGQMLNFNYSNPQTVAAYPFTYNTTYTDLFAMSYSISQGPLSITQFSYGSLAALGDAYGTLTTPSGTFTNCLRIKTITQQTDSQVFVGIPLPATVSHTNTTSYTWVNGAGAMGLFLISMDTIDDGSGTLQYSKSASYGSGTSAIKENAIVALSAYPNPTTDNATVKFTPNKSGNAYVEVMDISGKRVGYWTIEAQANQSQNLRIQLMTEPTGLYQVRIIQGNDIFSSRIIKQ